MQKHSPLLGFFILFSGLIVLGIYIPRIFFTGNPLPDISMAIAPACLTQVHDTLFMNDLPGSYLFFSLLLTQIIGIVLLSYLLWFYWSLFGTKNEKEARLIAAFKLTITISLISETLLFLFFMYSIPLELTDYSISNKVIAALTLAINSFNHAGTAHIFPPALIEQNFVLQIGIVSGSTLGGLGIFVLYELFSPNKLRERLSDPSIDWSFITKISIFGTAAILIIASITFFLMESRHFLADKNLMESVIASIYEISSARGFGSFLSENSTSSALKLIVSFLGSGPFSAGGGLSVLAIVWFYTLIWKSNTSNDILISKSIVLHLLTYSLFILSTSTILLFILDSESTLYDVFTSQLRLFTNNQLDINSPSNWVSDLIQGITMIAGRVGFILACYVTLRQQKN